MANQQTNDIMTIIEPMPNIIKGPNNHEIIWTGFTKDFLIVNNQDIFNKDLMFRNENPIDELDFRWVKIIIKCSQWQQGTVLHIRKKIIETHKPTYPHWETTGYKFTWEKIDELKFTDDIRAHDFFIDEKGYLWTEDKDKYALLKINCKYNLEVN